MIDFDSIYNILDREVKSYKVPVVDLIAVQTKDPFKVLVATLLSARTKDETTASVCKKLFPVIKCFEDLKNIDEDVLAQLIYPVGFYKTKAKHLKKLPYVLEDLFEGEIPQTIDELIKLPGVGRKTANLVVVIAFNKPGICVDTHVHRIMNRFGYIKTKTPLETEMTLRKQLPAKYWLGVNSILVAFGQNLCRPISPKCDICPVYQYCQRIGL